MTKKSALFDNQEENETTTGEVLALSTGKSPMLTVEQLAEHLGVSCSWLYKRVAADEVPHMKLGTAIRFDLEDVIAFFKSKGE